MTFAAAVLVSCGVFYTLIVLLDIQELGTTAKLDAKTLFDLVKLSFGVVAGAGALVALVVAYRRQRVDEVGAHRETTRLHTERFSQAVDKLGSDSPAVRLGGVHALAGLADDAPTHAMRQTCIDVLCAYLRLPYPSDPGNLADPQPEGNAPTNQQRDAHQDKKDRYRAFREVRHTILRLIGDHYRIPHGSPGSWQRCDLDLTGVTIDNKMDFGGAVFSGGTVSFAGAVFSDGAVNFGGAVFSDGAVNFGSAVFSGSTVSFTGSVFSGSTVYLGRAVFSGGTIFSDTAVFSGGTVHFGGAVFSGSTVNFGGAVFSGAQVYLRDAVFSGGTVDFAGAKFSGSTVYFDAAEFSDGTVSFGHAKFSDGTVSFDNATGAAPDGLAAAVASASPGTVTLPTAWSSTSY
ncbi:hypothetical protein ACFWAZ_38970 [Streptomyces collinus]|uniref:hypothetical protein n=1 Tax=Streptomyces collinus TaxID=42684 RepID=UPI00365EEDDC